MPTPPRAFIAYKTSLMFFFCATGMYFVTVNRAITAKKAKQLMATIRYTQPRTEFPFHHAKPLHICPETSAVTAFAFVAMLSNHFHEYGMGAAKLGHTLRRHSNLDLVMFELRTSPIPPATRELLNRSGWRICLVPPLNGPADVPQNTNRFLEAMVYSKLQAWRLIEYKAIALIDIDTLAVKDPSDIFTVQLPLMLTANKTLGAVRDHPSVSCYGSGAWNAFNAGLLLIVPSTRTFTRLINSIDRFPHNSALDAEQALINGVFKHTLFELPVVYNALTLIKSCEPALWLEHQQDFKIMHCTVTKPWTYSMRWTTVIDPFVCWFWRVEEYCMLWDMIDVYYGIW